MNKNTPESLQQVLNQITSNTNATKSSTGWTGHCPAHDDNHASLSISIGDKENILLKCFRGCTIDEITGSLNIKMSDLFSKIPLHDAKPKATITLDELAIDKHIPIEFLQKIGVCEQNNVIQITYMLANGDHAPRQRIRTALKAKDGSTWSKSDGKIVPYGLWRLQEAIKEGYLILCEGESDAWTLWLNHFPALGIPGATMINTLSLEHINDIPIIYVVQEPDEGGATFVKKIAEKLEKIGWDGELYTISCSPCKDPNDLYKENHEGFQEQLKNILERGNPIEFKISPNEKKNPKTSSPKMSDVLLDIVHEYCELICPPDNSKGYVSFNENGCRQTWPIESKSFSNWLNKKFYEMERKPPNQEALNETIRTTLAFCQYGKEGIPRHIDEVYLRIAQKNGNHYLDLCNEKWEAVEITNTGWNIISNPPVFFKRTPGMLPLPHPVRGGKINDLMNVINIWEDEFPLVAFWLVSSLRPEKPYPILLLISEQGSGKSTASRMLRSFIDPHKTDLRSLPENERDLAVAANSSHLLAFDNLSRIKDNLSDALCRISTGGGFSSRRLFTDEEETAFSFTRPIILNGIVNIASRPDLLDRCIAINLKSIPEDKRMDENSLWDKYEQLRPSILGSILDGTVSSLQRIQTVRLDRKPRMADFALWSAAAELGLEFPEGTFVSVYEQYREALINEAIENDHVASAIFKFMENHDEWQGTTPQLLEALINTSSINEEEEKELPKTATSLTQDLKRKVTIIREKGIDLNFHRTNKERLISLKKHNKSVTSVTTVTPLTQTIGLKEETDLPIIDPVFDDSDTCDTFSPPLQPDQSVEEEIIQGVI